MSSEKVPYHPEPRPSNPVQVPPASRPTSYNPNYVAPRVFGEVPQSVICQSCASNVVTRVRRTNGLLTWIAVGGLCLIGLGCGCCLIPFCINDLKDVEHFCPNCNHLVGIHKKIK